jgi:hypothetical protein
MTSASTIQCFNVASRLEARPKDYRIPIVIGAQTEQQAKEKFATLEIDRIQVKGKTDPETVFHGAWASGTRSRFQFAGITRAHRRMLRSYREQDWARAIETIELCRKAAECSGIATLYDMSAERVKAFRRTPPPDWNGVYEAESKLQKRTGAFVKSPSALIASWTNLPQSHSGAISVRKLDSCGFKRGAERRHGRIMGEEHSRLSLETFNGWKRDRGSFCQLTLLPAQKRSGSAN